MNRIPHNSRYALNEPLVLKVRYARYGQVKPEGSCHESKSHKMPREDHKRLLWKSVGKKPILQPIHY